MRSDESGVNSLFVLRPAESGDISFIFNSFLKSYRDGEAVRSVPNTVYYAEQHKVIEKILQRPQILVSVACCPEDHSEIYGFVICEYRDNTAIIHWCYVKFALRGFGVAKSLLDLVVTDNIQRVEYSHRTKVIDKLGNRLKDFIYNPYTAFYGE